MQNPLSKQVMEFFMNNYLEIDFSNITSEKFEELALDYVNIIFSEDNTNIVHTPYKKDGGKDIIITHISKITNYRTWIECKNHKRNLGLAEIGKNVVLVISKKVNKLIYISASEITENTKNEILNVGDKNNFEVLFLDDKNYKRELYKYPQLIHKYFDLLVTKSFDSFNDISVQTFFSEFENGLDIAMNSCPIFYLERNNTFYLNFIVKNHTKYDIDNISFEVHNQEDGLHIYSGNRSIQRISKMSDCSIQFFCVYSGYKSKIKFPDYKITYNHNGITKTKIIENTMISLNHLARIPLVGKKVNEFILNKWNVISKLAKRHYAQAILIYGNSGTGKTRLMEELELLSKKERFSSKYIDCKNKRGSYILKRILSFVLDIPFDNHSIQYTKEDIREIIEREYGKDEYTDCLYDLFVNDKLNEYSIFYLERALIYFIQNPRFNNAHVLLIDNIQECDEFILNLISDLINELQHCCVPFILVLSANIEVLGTSNDETKQLIRQFESIEQNITSFCYTFFVEDLQKEEARLFLTNLFINIEYDDPIIDQFINKSGTRPFEMLMLFKYLTENGIFTMGKSLKIPSITKYNDFLMCVPPKINNLIEERILTIKKNLTVQLWGDCEKIIKCLLLFYNKFPSGLLEIILDSNVAKNKLLNGFIIKYQKHSNDIEFYHDTIYRFFLKRNEYNDIGELGVTILEWLEKNENYELENKEKIIFYCYFKTGQIKKAISLGMELIYKYFNSFDFRSVYEICEQLYNLDIIKTNKELYFKICYMYAMSSWETVDIYKTLDIYKEIHSFIDSVIDIVSIEDICRYYREYINANSHAGLYSNILPLLEEFKRLPNISKEYQFVVHNRYNVFYMRTNMFSLAKEHGEKAYAIAEALNNDFFKSTACSDIAFNYLYNKSDYSNAKKYFQKAISYYKQEDDFTYYRQLEIYNQRSIISFIEKDYDYAIKVLKKSISKSHQLHNRYMEAKALNYKGIFESHAGYYKDAYKSWTEALRITEKLGNFSTLICIYFNLSSLFLLENDYSKAYESIKKALSILKDDKNPVQISENFNVLFHNYIICCNTLAFNDEIELLLEQYPQYNSFYQTLLQVINVRGFLSEESMNYYGKDGYSFL